MATILVIDDERLLCDLLQECFARAGHQVLTASSSEEGLRLFQQAHPDVTLLDLALPGMNGIIVLRKIRAMDKTAPVIVLTGVDHPDIEHAVRELGVNDLLRKRLGLDVLVQAVERTLKASAPPSATRPPEAPHASARILVVDDDPGVCELLQEFLRLEGYEVVTAATGEEALSFVERFHPQLVLLDLELPGRNGLTVLRRLAAERQHPGVIIITGHGDAASIEEALALGSFDYLTKPLDLEQLGVSVRAKLALMEVGSSWWRRWLRRE